LAVRQLGVIEDASLDLATGLTVITGETGAGKTMLLNALRALMGERTDPGLVRHGAAGASVEGLWRLASGHHATQRAEQAGALVDDGQLLAVRTFTAKGRSRAVLGGMSVPAGVLGQVVGSLVAIHGQSDQLRLRQVAQQRELLDAAGGHQDQLASYQAAFQAWRGATTQLAALDQAAQQDGREAAELQAALAQIERLGPQVGEEDELPITIDRLANAGELALGVQGAHAALVGDDSAQPNAAGLADQANRLLEGLSRHDPALGALAGRARDLAYLASDLAAELAEYGADLEPNPAALEAAQLRRAELTTVLRRHGATVAEVLAWAQGAQARLEQLDASEVRREALIKEVQATAAQLASAAKDLSEARRRAAAQLIRAMEHELAALGMDQARFDVAFAPSPTAQLGGQEDVEFLFTAHHEVPLKPIAKSASGGELSRLMLALELVLAESGAAGGVTLVFDEVDQGVAGRAAAQVGQRLARLAQHTQVLVVTHLPQVAAHGQVHLVVEKTGARAGIVPVTGLARNKEIARMLAGREDSASALEHAEELLRHAGVEQ